MKQKIKGFVTSKSFRTALLMACMVAVLSLSAFADDGTTADTITSAFSTGFTAIVSDAKSMIGTIVPIALGLAGVIFLVKRAMGWFKSLSK